MFEWFKRYRDKREIKRLKSFILEKDLTENPYFKKEYLGNTILDFLKILDIIINYKDFSKPLDIDELDRVKRYRLEYFYPIINNYTHIDENAIDSLIERYNKLSKILKELEPNKKYGGYGFNYNVVEAYIIELMEVIRSLIK